MKGETHAGQEMRSCAGSRRRSLAESELVRTGSLLLSRERGTGLNKIWSHRRGQTQWANGWAA